MRRAFVPSVLGFTAIAMLGGWLIPVAAQETKTLESGRRLYEIYCGNCHGAEAHGDGPTAKILSVRPPDLTLLAASNKGEFPLERTHRIIDGREVMGEHGATEMPIWGLEFQVGGRDANQEFEVRARIRQLIRYLESIQVKSD